MAHILVVDDDENVRKFISLALQRAGHQVTVACDGEEALELYAKNPFDIVILDIIMPRKEGIETIIELRLKDPEVQIIAISGGGRVGPENYLMTACELGAVTSLEKPFTVHELNAVISSLLAPQG